jgi:hypothetical protein
MSARKRLLILAVVPALTLLLSSQTATPVLAPKPPQLKLEIIPLKKTYFVGETVFVKYRLTSLADGTLFSSACRGSRAILYGILHYGRDVLTS